MRILSYIFLLIVFAVPILANTTCPIETVSVPNLRGKVVGEWKNGLYPIASTRIEVRRIDDKQSLIFTTKTNASGYFELRSIKKGSYQLIVFRYANDQIMFRYTISLQLIKKKTKVDDGTSILVTLGIDCYDSKVAITYNP